MSRRIMEWPSDPVFGDTVEVDANTVEEFELPNCRMEAFDFNSNETHITSFYTVAKAYEDREGIFLKLVEEDESGELSRNESETLEVDEKAFVTDIYQAIKRGDTAEDSEMLRKSITTLATNYAKSKLSGGKWFFRVSYEGFGVICTGNEIIGTIDEVYFDQNKVTLDYCVGNINLNNVVDCNVQFNVNGKCFKITDFNMETVKSDNDYYCTYELTNYKGEVIEHTVVDDKVEELTRYSPGNEEVFVAERSKIIGDDARKSKISFDDLDDILD